jgi:hypothetical protein
MHREDVEVPDRHREEKTRIERRYVRSVSVHPAEGVQVHQEIDGLRPSPCRRRQRDEYPRRGSLSDSIPQAAERNHERRYQIGWNEKIGNHQKQYTRQLHDGADIRVVSRS